MEQAIRINVAKKDEKPGGGIQVHSMGALAPLVCVVKEPAADAVDRRLLHYFIDPRKDGKDVTGEWKNPMFAHKHARVYLWGYSFDKADPLGNGLSLFAAAEGRSVGSLYRAAEDWAFDQTGNQE